MFRFTKALKQAPLYSKYINYNGDNRFVNKTLLRDNYLVENNKYDPFVKLGKYELAIVNTEDINIAKAISCILTRSVEMAKDTHGGYVPASIISRAQLEYVSPHAVHDLWGKSGYRFVLSKESANNTREIVGTALITKDHNKLFFFTSKYHNVVPEDIDQNDYYLRNFDFPDISDYKIPLYNQLANFSIDIEHRNKNLGDLMLYNIIKYYTIGNSYDHSQPILLGEGIFQIADPAWRNYMAKLGFKNRNGAETFYVEYPKSNDRLLPTIMDGKPISNIDFNKKFGLPQRLENYRENEYDITDRVPKVIELAASGYAKLQYFQLYTSYDEYIEKRYQ